MKLLFIITLLVCLGVNQEIYAEIKNGYDNEVKKAQKYISDFNVITAFNAVPFEKLKKYMQGTHATVEKMHENHAKTRELIEKFRMIDPGLYHEINTIQDREGNETDVYIKVVDDLRPDLQGATNVNHSVDNPNVYSSEYGDYTVSVRVSYKNLIWALRILVHELGHVRYQVPHLAEYTAFYKRFYNTNIIGHRYNDPSHQSVQETLKTFKASWKGYRQEMKWIAKNKSRKILAFNKEK